MIPRHLCKKSTSGYTGSLAGRAKDCQRILVFSLNILHTEFRYVIPNIRCTYLECGGEVTLCVCVKESELETVGIVLEGLVSNAVLGLQALAVACNS